MFGCVEYFDVELFVECLVCLVDLLVKCVVEFDLCDFVFVDCCDVCIVVEEVVEVLDFDEI